MQMNDIIQQLATLSTALPQAYDKEVLEFNQLMDELDNRAEQVNQLTSALEQAKLISKKDNELLNKQHLVVEKAIEAKKKDEATIRSLQVQLKELQSLNPKRLAKVNKELQKKNTELKKANEELNKQRHEMANERNQFAKQLKAHTDNLIHADENGNELRFIPQTVVSETNEYGGVPNTPIYEYLHRDRGIKRQGVLRNDGNIVWSSAQNSTPSEVMTAIAKEHVVAHCKRNKINLKKQLKLAA